MYTFQDAYMILFSIWIQRLYFTLPFGAPQIENSLVVIRDAE